MKEILESAIKALTKKAEGAQLHHEAMQFSQAALNISHILAMISNTKP